MLVLALVAVAPALAQQPVTPPPGLEEPPPPLPPPPGGISVSRQGPIVISSEVCDRLRHAAAADPGADYRPGVDVNGDAVAPADLPPGGPPTAASNFPIAIGLGMQNRYGIPANSALLGGGAIIGMVTLNGGQAYFNGAPISGNERDMMLEACAAAKR